MPRTLVKTTTAGWYINSEDPDGSRVRKAAGDLIVTREKFEAMKADAATRSPVDTSTAPVKALTSGKVGVGKTVTIRCAWVDPDKRTDAQKKLFAKGAQALSYDAVLKAAGDNKAAMPDGRERVIKAQDAFQVRFHPDNQKKWRSELRRRKAAERRARKAAKA